MRFSLKEDGKKLLVITAAAALMAVNVNTFVHAGGLYPGGATGLTILLQRIGVLYLHVEIPYTVLNVLLNLFPIYLGFRFIGKKFTLYSCYMILLTGVLTDLIPAHFLTSDPLLDSVFGGILNGTVVSLCLMMDATTGGTDFIAIYLSQKRNMETWNLILAFNTVLLSAAGLLFGWDKALYSIIFQFVSTQIIHTFYRHYQQETLLIVSEKSSQITDAIHRVCHHGATVLKGYGAYSQTEKNMIYSVVSRSDMKTVIQTVRSVDPDAFINSIRTEQLTGRFYYKPRE